MKFNRRYFLISLGSALGLAFNSCKNFQQTQTTNAENFNSQIPANQTISPS
ncbi:hypothetical protein [Okeania sp. SIO2C9]|uniref:hypothetical protein n=1 Tax=Okeania sp. SIO2C9 TaxID=2607791 RepID=UPI0025E46491|nr:hypothetical protein [Okeania sp. SIO2C9]